MKINMESKTMNLDKGIRKVKAIINGEIVNIKFSNKNRNDDRVLGRSI